MSVDPAASVVAYALAMSQANKTILERANAAISRGDYDGFLDHCTDDVVWTFVGDRTIRGKAAVRAYMAATYDGPPSFRVERMVAEGDTVIALGDIDLKDADGRVVRREYCDVWRVRDGKLASLKAFVVEPN